MLSRERKHDNGKYEGSTAIRTRETRNTKAVRKRESPVVREFISAHETISASHSGVVERE